VVKQQTPSYQVTVLRVVVGCAWIVAGLEKVLNSSYEPTLRTMLQHWAAGTGDLPQFIGTYAVPNAWSLAFAIKAGELLIGLLLVTGFVAPLAALAGFAVVAAAWVFKQSFMSMSGYADGNFIIMATMLFLAVAPHHRLVVLRSRRREPIDMMATTVTPTFVEPSG
jgi:uncharacterized membrane protein YphA (DoxX/SURF4 family)